MDNECYLKLSYQIFVIVVKSYYSFRDIDLSMSLIKYTYLYFMKIKGMADVIKKVSTMLQNYIDLIIIIVSSLKNKNMKRLIILSAIALLGLSSCKKEAIEPVDYGNKVIYTVICDSCTAIIDLNNGTKEIKVNGFYQRGEINKLETINITTIGTGKIKSSLKVNDVYLHRVENIQNGDTISYDIKIK